MAEYIERKMLLRSLIELGYSCCDYWPGIRDVILTESAADVAPLVLAEWKPYRDHFTKRRIGWICTNCSGVQMNLSNGDTAYCPNCGARMDGE